MDIDISKLPKEITDKYSVDKNTFFATPKDDWKDRIQIEIGDSKDPTTFQPQVKIMRWDNECNVSYRLVDDEVKTESVSTVGDKIVWTKGDKEINLYDLKDGEGGFEFEVILKSKPKTNVIEFTLQDKDVEYFYQPELTAEEIAQGASRPENVVGSYAVYAKTPKTNWTGGKEYKVGKVGHIFRPKIIDSAGTEVWGDLHIENGILSVTIPQDFLDNAVYPIKHAAGLTFGYTTIGTGGTTSIRDRISGSQFTGVAGEVTKITAYCRIDGGSFGIASHKAGIYIHSSLALLTNGDSTTITSDMVAAAWNDYTFSSNPTASAVDYVLVLWQNEVNTPGGYSLFNYDDGDYPDSTTQGHYQNYDWSDNSGALPATLTVTHEDKKYSIYATYTAAGGAKANNLSLLGVG